MQIESHGEGDVVRRTAERRRSPRRGIVDATVDRVVPDDRGTRAALHAALDSLVRLIEQQLPDMYGSVLLLDDDGLTLRHGAAPHLPLDYCRAIDGARIGPAAGSCGTAAWRRERVVVEDIATDPLWAEYRELALPHGLRACWSTPIADASGRVLGTFAMYYREPRLPGEAEDGLTRTAALLACNIIVRARAEHELRERTETAERTARALADSETRLLATCDALERARTEAEHANRAKASFLAMMSHELRTPLNAIGGYAKLMLDGIPTPATEGQKNYLRRIAKAQEHLTGLIDTVLTHAKLEAGQMTYRITNIPMGELLDAVEAMVRPQVAAREIDYDCSACDGRLVLRGDRSRVVQILLNVLSNAVKFTPRGGRIAVRTETQGSGRAAIGVRDTGIGMTASQLSVVFEPFVQFDNGLTRQEKGTGLGVPISRELARGMGGDLTVSSEPGVGTEFVLLLPADESALAAH